MEDLKAHFANLIDRQATARANDLAAETERMRKREDDRRWREEEHQEFVMLADDLVHALRDMQLLFHKAGLVIPLVENIERQKDTAVKFICVGQEYRLAVSTGGYSTPARLYLTVREASGHEPSGDGNWRTAHYLGLPPGPIRESTLVQQMMDYVFNEATRKLGAVAQARLGTFLSRHNPPSLKS